MYPNTLSNLDLIFDNFDIFSYPFISNISSQQHSNIHYVGFVVFGKLPAIKRDLRFLYISAVCSGDSQFFPQFFNCKQPRICFDPGQGATCLTVKAIGGGCRNGEGRGTQRVMW
ncbi:hypothetical protein Tco_1091228 [Tanacetum coccineum]|uniref:Uncharacterized protein n=1 Tax=Tanacetum coccineum TaxID=301880 RepID=A0ABQ5I6L6_9ASTR